MQHPTSPVSAFSSDGISPWPSMAWSPHQVDLLRDLRLVGFWQRDLTTGEARWDSVCRAIWGVPEGEPVPSLDAARRRVDDEQERAFRQYMDDLAAGRLRGEVQYAIPTPEGRRQVRSVWHRDGDQVYGVLVDITHEHQLGAELADLLKSLALAAPAVQMVLWRFDPASDAVHWLPHGLAPIGPHGVATSSGSTELEAVFPEDLPDLLAARARALADFEITEVEYRVLDAQGRVHHLLSRQIGQTGVHHRPELVGVTLDVTVRREREIALRRQTKVQRLALQALRAGVFRFEIAERRFSFDTSLLALYGLPPSDAVLGFDQWLAHVEPADQAFVKVTAEALIAQPATVGPVRFRWRRPDGQTRWIESDRVPESGPHGLVVALIGTHRDITEELRLAELAKAREAAELVGRTRSELLAMLAHELRTPLNAVSGFAQLIGLERPGHVSDPADLRAAQQIQAAARQMTALLDDLSDFASAEAGHLVWHPEDVPLEGLLEECRQWSLRSDASHEERLPPARVTQPLVVRADPVRARQIVLNLVGNALKYSAHEVRVSAVADGDQVRVDVVDRGPGMSPAQIERAFAPFERLGREHGAVKGSGLGLAVCRRLARLMHGDVTVSSRPGEGSMFSLRLPRVRD